MTLVHLVGPQAELGSDTLSQPHGGPQSLAVPLFNGTSPCFPKLEGVAFKGGLMGTIKQTWAEGWAPAPPHEGNNDLYPISCSQNIKKDWEFPRVVLRQKAICMVGLNPLFPPLWKGKLAVCYFSLDFNAVRSLQRSKAAMENRLGSDFGLMQIISSPWGCWDDGVIWLGYMLCLTLASISPSIS